MKQNDTEYHQLYLMIKDADDYFPKEDIKELLNLIKKLYEDNQELINEKDSEGKYGIRYKNVNKDLLKQCIIDNYEGVKEVDNGYPRRQWDKEDFTKEELSIIADEIIKDYENKSNVL